MAYVPWFTEAAPTRTCGAITVGLAFGLFAGCTSLPDPAVSRPHSPGSHAAPRTALVEQPLPPVGGAESFVTSTNSARKISPLNNKIDLAGHAIVISDKQASLPKPPAGDHQMGGHGKHMPMASPPLQPDVGKKFLPPPSIPEAPAALRGLEAGTTQTNNLPLTLAAVEQLACSNNPTLMQAKAQVDGAFGKAIQAGLWPNPTIGYQQEQINVKGTAGEFVGGFIEQKIVTGNKLKLSRAKFVERTRAAEWLVMAQEYRILNDVRMHFYRTLGRQELVKIHQELLKNQEDQLVTVREKYNLGQATRAQVHQANVKLQEERLNFLLVENDYRQSFETLTALIGVDLAMGPLEGELEGDLSPIEWDQALSRLISESPELKSAEAKLRDDIITVQREKVQAIPNLVIRGGAGRNFETNENVGNVGVGFDVPIFDWNQGTVKQAEADLVRQRGEARRTELRLRRKLAETYRNYLTSFQHVENFKSVVLPESRKAYETLLDSYEQHRIDWEEVLHAQRDYFQHRAQYVKHLITWRENEVSIAGYLLHGGLESPIEVTPPGHIDSVPKPR